MMLILIIITSFPHLIGIWACTSTVIRGSLYVMFSAPVFSGYFLYFDTFLLNLSQPDSNYLPSSRFDYILP